MLGEILLKIFLMHKIIYCFLLLMLILVFTACDSDIDVGPSVLLPETPSEIITPPPAASDNSTLLTVISDSKLDEPETELECDVDFHTVAMWDEQTGWIFGDKGIILRYDIASGRSTPTWRQSDNLPEPYPLEAFSPVSTTEGWGIMGYVIRYQDGVWENTQKIKGADLRDIIMLNTSEGWAVGRDVSQPTEHRDGLIFHYSQGEWSREFTLPYREGLLAIDMLNSEEGWVVGWENLIIRFQNQQWKQVKPALDGGYALIDVDVVSEEEAWFVGGWIILHYYNGKWEEVAPDLTKKLLFDPTIDMVNAEEGWIVGSKGYILHYQDGKWQKVDSPTNNDLLSISMINAEEGWAVGRNGTILHYQNGAWELINEAPTTNK